MDSTTMKGTVQGYFDRAFDEMTDQYPTWDFQHSRESKRRTANSKVKWPAFKRIAGGGLNHNFARNRAVTGDASLMRVGREGTRHALTRLGKRTLAPPARFKT